jgi:hypothetical protein
MTYILTHNQNGSTAIFADSMLTGKPLDSDDPVRDFGVKNGIVIPGCIYGLSGDFHEATRFVLLCREKAGDCTDPTINFETIQRTAKSGFTVSPGCSFKMALSSRHSGNPQHYRLDSRTMQITEVHDTFELGSGTPALNPVSVAALSTMVSPAAIELLADGSSTVTVDDWPYLLCFFLHQNSFGSREYDLLNVDAGGTIHFVQQTPTAEFRQKTSMYVLAQNLPGFDGIGLYRYRYVFEDDQLLIYTKRYGEKGTWSVLLTNWLQEKVTVDIDEFKSKWNALIKQHTDGPPYYFLVAGLSNWEGEPLIPYIDKFDGRSICADLDDYLEPNLDNLLRRTGVGRGGEVIEELKTHAVGRLVHLSPHSDKRQWPRDFEVIPAGSCKWKTVD